ncbi:MAG: hypothetical protein AAFO03_28870 [Bacteroidota bacterium]
MDLQQAKILLEKINALQKSISLDKGEVSTIERDLMLSYIRQLYETYLSSEVSSAPAPKAKTVAPPPPPKVEPAPKKAAAPPPPSPPPAPEPKPEPIVAPPKPAPEPPAAKPAPVAQAAPSPAPAKSNVDPAINALFKHQAARELSEKLSQQAIPDLTRAMSINDKLLYSNELFGRDMARMNETLQKLNGLGSMDDAQNYLVDIAQKFDWTEDERSEVAQSFIKLIRRKY